MVFHMCDVMQFPLKFLDIFHHSKSTKKVKLCIAKKISLLLEPTLGEVTKGTLSLVTTPLETHIPKPHIKDPNPMRKKISLL